MIQSRDPSRLFEVYGCDGERLYTVCGQYLGPRGNFGVFAPDGKEAACFRRIGSDSMGYYRVCVGGQEVFSVLKRFIGHRPALQLQGLLWHVRGDTATRSFDVTDRDGRVLMTHGLTVKNGQMAYGITLPEDETQALCCLCIAMILDLSSSTLRPAPLAGGQI